ncbi:hypothetical protein THAOC_23343, partial [Thalassiosira oceanica]
DADEYPCHRSVARHRCSWPITGSTRRRPSELRKSRWTKAECRMARTTRNSVKRRRVATVESALFNPDVLFLLASLLDARDLCQVSLTCKTLGGKQAGHNGLSLIEAAARRTFDCASDWETSCLPKYDDEGWIELYHHLLMLRSKLTFDQLVGDCLRYGFGGRDDDLFDRSTVQTFPGRLSFSSALCSNHVMRSGRHFAVFTKLNFLGTIGVVRPMQINVSDLGDGALRGFYEFSPTMRKFREYLRGKQTVRWKDSNVHCCAVDCDGRFFWYDWTYDQEATRIEGFDSDSPFALLLDLDEGTLSMYQFGRSLGVLKNGLSGEYCWYANIFAEPITITRGLDPND